MILHCDTSKMVTVMEHGKRRRLTNKELIVRRVVGKAVDGDEKSIKLVLDECRKGGDATEQKPIVRVIIDGLDVAHESGV